MFDLLNHTEEMRRLDSLLLEVLLVLIFSSVLLFGVCATCFNLTFANLCFCLLLFTTGVAVSDHRINQNAR